MAKLTPQEVKFIPYKNLSEHERYLRYKPTHEANRIKNKEKRRLACKKWHSDNKEKSMLYNKRWKEQHKEELLQYSKDYRKTLRGAISHRMNSRKRYRQEIDLTLETSQQVYEDNIKKYGTLTCVLCLNPVEFGQDSLEHLTPLSRGGTNDYYNLGVAHKLCNCKKHTKTLEEWRMSNGR